MLTTFEHARMVHRGRGDAAPLVPCLHVATTKCTGRRLQRMRVSKVVEQAIFSRNQACTWVPFIGAASTVNPGQAVEIARCHNLEEHREVERSIDSGPFRRLTL